MNTDQAREKIIYEYTILRYVPDLERGECVNIGLMMMCKRHKWHRTGIYINSDRIKAICPDADVARLKCQTGIFTSTDVPFADIPVEEKYRWLAAVKSAIIQTSPSHPGILLKDSKESPRQQLDALFDTLFARLVI